VARVSLMGIANMVDMVNMPSIMATASVASMLGPACGAKAVPSVRRGPTCRRRCVR
jgi:hypothetical protein